jgi:hypothetical protein
MSQLVSNQEAAAAATAQAAGRDAAAGESTHLGQQGRALDEATGTLAGRNSPQRLLLVISRFFPVINIYGNTGFGRCCMQNPTRYVVQHDLTAT